MMKEKHLAPPIAIQQMVVVTQAWADSEYFPTNFMDFSDLDITVRKDMVIFFSNSRPWHTILQHFTHGELGVWNSRIKSCFSVVGLWQLVVGSWQLVVGRDGLWHGFLGQRPSLMCFCSLRNHTIVWFYYYIGDEPALRNAPHPWWFYSSQNATELRIANCSEIYQNQLKWSIDCNIRSTEIANLLFFNLEQTFIFPNRRC
jgi:hypothetical protein